MVYQDLFLPFAGLPSGASDFVGHSFHVLIETDICKSIVATMYLLVIAWAEVYAAAS
jgi:hypothetical protein